MSNWLEGHTDLPDHPKLLYCASLLKVDPDLLVGKLYRLWSWAMNNRESGRFLSCELPLIAEKMRWKKRASSLIDALCAVAPGEQAGWLVKIADGYAIYNWEKYSGKLMEKRKKDRERKEKVFRKSKDNSVEKPQKILKDSVGIPTEIQQNSDVITLNPLPFTDNHSTNPPLSPKGETVDTEIPKKKSRKKKATNSQAEKAEIAKMLEPYSNDFKTVFGHFLESRAKKHNSPTPYAVNRLLIRLHRLADNEQEQITLIDRAIEGGWTGFHPINEPKGRQPTKSFSDPDRYRNQDESYTPDWMKEESTDGNG